MMSENSSQHGASCTCPPCMERSDRAFTVWYDPQDADPPSAVLAQTFTAWYDDAATPTTATKVPRVTYEPPPWWAHRAPMCGACGAVMRLPRHQDAADGWTYGPFGWRHGCRSEGETTR